jgi:hypothetical protein
MAAEQENKCWTSCFGRNTQLQQQKIDNFKTKNLIFFGKNGVQDQQTAS